MRVYTFKDCTISIPPPKRATGHALTIIAIERGIHRRWFERIPVLGDRWLRRRLTIQVRQTTNVNYRDPPYEKGKPDTVFNYHLH
jgi:hypothetical protein